MKSFVTGLVTLGAAIAIPLTAPAAPLQSNWVAGDATWVVHLDVEAVHASTVGKAFVDHVREHLEHEDDNGARFVASLIREVKGVTLFGSGDDEEDGVIIVSATKDLDEAVNALPAIADNYRKIVENNRTFHSFGEDDEQWYVYQRPDDNPDRRVLLIAHKMERLTHGIVNMEGAGANPPAAPLRDVAPRPGTVLFVSASDLAPIRKHHDEQASRILGGANSLLVNAGEYEGKVFASLRLDCDTAQEAADSAQVVQGLLALGRIVLGSEKELGPLLKALAAVRVAPNGNSMTMDFSYDAAALSDLIAHFGEIAEELHGHGHHDHDDDLKADDDMVKIEKKIKEKHKRHHESKDEEEKTEKPE
ncbi:MAG TPA: hypothetical protein VG797_08885 [Phycisphaerales bacterium]|nr:hypothetical protein [Phycisphaerales bacterium]